MSIKFKCRKCGVKVFPCLDQASRARIIVGDAPAGVEPDIYVHYGSVSGRLIGVRGTAVDVVKAKARGLFVGVDHSQFCRPAAAGEAGGGPGSLPKG